MHKALPLVHCFTFIHAQQLTFDVIYVVPTTACTVPGMFGLDGAKAAVDPTARKVDLRGVCIQLLALAVAGRGPQDQQPVPTAALCHLAHLRHRTAITKDSSSPSTSPYEKMTARVLVKDMRTSRAWTLVSSVATGSASDV